MISTTFRQLFMLYRVGFDSTINHSFFSWLSTRLEPSLIDGLDRVKDGQWLVGRGLDERSIDLFHQHQLDNFSRENLCVESCDLCDCADR